MIDLSHHDLDMTSFVLKDNISSRSTLETKAWNIFCKNRVVEFEFYIVLGRINFLGKYFTKVDLQSEHYCCGTTT